MRKLASLILISVFMLSFVGCYERSAVAISYGPPPPQIVGPVGYAPGPEFLWIDGYWGWSGRAYYWVPGRWERRPHHNAVWVSGYWTQRNHGWVWVGGRWRH